MSEYGENGRGRELTPFEVSVAQLLGEAWSIIQNDPVKTAEYSAEPGSEFEQYTGCPADPPLVRVVSHPIGEWWFAAAVSAKNAQGKTATFTGVNRYLCPPTIDIDALYNTADEGCIRARRELAFDLESNAHFYLKVAAENAIEEAKTSGFDETIALALTCPPEFHELMPKATPAYEGQFAAIVYSLFPNQIIPIKGMERWSEW